MSTILSRQCHPRSWFRSDPEPCPLTPSVPRSTTTKLSSTKAILPSVYLLILATMATANWRTINIDLFDPDSPANFPISSLQPSIVPVSTSEVQTLSSQIRQLLRGGDTEGALRGALENAPYGGDVAAKVGKEVPV